MGAPWAAADGNQKPSVEALYQKNLADGMSAKEAAKSAQQETGVSVVSGRAITKKVEFSSKGKIKYGGQYADSTIGRSKHWKPAAWAE
jgi:hypothetical protein